MFIPACAAGKQRVVDWPDCRSSVPAVGRFQWQKLSAELHCEIAPQPPVQEHVPATPAPGFAPWHEPAAPVGQLESLRQEMVPEVMPSQICWPDVLVTLNRRWPVAQALLTEAGLEGLEGLAGLACAAIPAAEVRLQRRIGRQTKRRTCICAD